MFSCEFCEISKSTFFTKYLWVTASGEYIILSEIVRVVSYLSCFVKYCVILITLITYIWSDKILTGKSSNLLQISRIE